MVKRALLFVFLAALSVSLARAGSLSVPAGSTLHCRLTQTLTTRSNAQGDAFAATVTEPLPVSAPSVIPVGSTIQGRISWIERPGRFRGVGEMHLTADKLILPDGRSFPVSTVLLTTDNQNGVKVVGEEGVVKGPSSSLRTLKEVGIGMGGGGFLGTLIGGFHGAVIGGAVGGAAGFVDTLRRRGQDLKLPMGTQLNFELTQPLDLGK